MKTLIELYDQLPIKNVLSTEVFRPERTVFVCSPETAGDVRLREGLRNYFRSRGIPCELIFRPAEINHAESVEAVIRSVIREYPDCALDIAGGTDAGLFAAGRISTTGEIPVFTFSRKKLNYFNIVDAPFAHHVGLNVQLSVEDCLLMAGGAMRTGRVAQEALERYKGLFEPFFRVYLGHRDEWNDFIAWMQNATRPDPDGRIRLETDCARVQNGPRGKRIDVNEPILRELSGIGMVRDLNVGARVSFRLPDEQIRAWLRDIGSVLETYIWRICKKSGLFHEVRSSVIVEWQPGTVRDAVTNEIDVVATRGIEPLFISCKTCDVKTEALNELAVLRTRFGGVMAKSCIVTAEHTPAAVRHRATELGIYVIDMEDLLEGTIPDQLRQIVGERADD